MTLLPASRISILLLFALATVGCAPCDLAVSKYDFEFTILDAVTGENLISGEAPKLDPHDIQLYSIRDSERLPHVLIPYPKESFAGDQVILADIQGHSGDLYLEYPDGEVDTLQAFLSRQDTECSGTIYSLQGIIRNRSETFTDMYAVLEFKY